MPPTRKRSRPSAGRRLIEGQDVMLEILGHLDDRTIRKTASVHSFFLLAGCDVLARRHVYSLEYAEKLRSGTVSVLYAASSVKRVIGVWLKLSKPTRDAIIASLRSISTCTPLQVHRHRPASWAFSPSQLDQLCRKFPRLRSVRCDAMCDPDQDLKHHRLNKEEAWVGTTPQRSWMIDISARIIDIGEVKLVRRKRDLTRAYMRLEAAIESLWEGYTISRRLNMRLTYEQPHMIHEQTFLADLVKDSRIKRFTFDHALSIDDEVDLASIDAAVEVLDLRRRLPELGRLEEVRLLGCVKREQVDRLLEACDGVCGALLLYEHCGEALLGRDVPVPHGTKLIINTCEEEPWDRMPLPTPLDPAAPPSIELTSWRLSYLGPGLHLGHVALSLGNLLTHLDLGSHLNQSEEFGAFALLENRLEDLYNVVLHVLDVLPSLKTLRLTITLPPDPSYLASDFFYQYPLRPWPGPLEIVDITLCLSAEDWEDVPEWRYVPYFDLALRLASLCASPEALRFTSHLMWDQSTWDPKLQRHRKPSDTGGLDDEEFMDIVRWLFTRTRSQQKKLLDTYRRGHRFNPYRDLDDGEYTWRDMKVDPDGKFFRPVGPYWEGNFTNRRPNYRMSAAEVRERWPDNYWIE